MGAARSADAPPIGADYPHIISSSVATAETTAWRTWPFYVAVAILRNTTSMRKLIGLMCSKVLAICIRLW